MNLGETAQALALAQAYDRRTVGEMDVRAWHALLADAPAADVMEAVRRHYAEQTDWIMPAHIRRMVRDIARERETSPWAAGQYGVPREDAAPEVRGADRLALSDLPAAVADLVSRVRADLPEGSREALMPRKVAWEREHAAFRRQQAAEPNPRYRPRTAIHDDVIRLSEMGSDGHNPFLREREHECLIKDGHCVAPGHPAA